MQWEPVPEARMERTEQGELVPGGPGWFVVNVAEARGLAHDQLGAGALFDGSSDVGASFAEIGVTVRVLRPGQPNGLYHRENAQEGYLVLHGECLLLVEGEERRMRTWDYAHLPAGTAHICVGAGDGPCAVLMVGARRPDHRLFYPVSETAARHGASAERETASGREAYARFAPPARRLLPWPPG